MGSLRVLLAEDHQDVANRLRHLLETEFEVIGVVGDGGGLVEAVDQMMPDVIVSDLNLPVSDGLSAARVILTRHPNARIVFVTVADDPRIVRRAVLLGALGYVVKSDAAEELLTAVRAAWSGQLHLSTSVRESLN
ncbi:MAG TPA: response regulator transcription factor [Vicinamibacterales bacterium]